MKDMIEYLKIILPIIAIGISIVSLVISKKNFKRQIRIAKLEEMLECFYYVSTHYTHFRTLLLDLEYIQKLYNSKSDHTKEIADYKEKIKTIKEREIFEKIISKSNRAGILSNSYLPNGTLKFQISSTCRLINLMAESLKVGDLYPINSFSNKLPSRSSFAKIIEKIEREIINEMDLGFESQKWEDLNNYCNNQFKKELGIE